MKLRMPLLIQYRVLFPLLAFAAVAIASETYGEAAGWLALPALAIYLIAPWLPVRNIRRKLLADRPPVQVADRWATISREYGVEADLHLIEYGSANGVAAGGRRGGIAAITPQALAWEEASLDLLFRYLAVQLRMGASRHSARAALIWLYTGAFCALLGSYAWFTDDEISLLGWILSLLFGLMFVFGSGGYAHQVKWAIDRRMAEITHAPHQIRALIERVIKESPAFMEVDVPTFTAPLWFALPQDDKEKGENPVWDSLTRDRFKALGA